MEKEKKVRRFALICYLLGICLFVFPLGNKLWKKQENERACQRYQDLSSSTSSPLFDMYNKTLSEDEYQRLPELLGFLAIPSISLTCPVYRTTEETVLNKGIGHLQGTQVPSTTSCRSVFVGHNGLSSQEIFTNLNQVQIGDSISFLVEKQTFVFIVKEIRVCLPEELETELQKEIPLTLVTCTPYGSNSHRLLIRCERKELQ